MTAPTIDAMAEPVRPRLLAIAYRMLGSMTDAEDVVQEALLKAHRAQPEDLESSDAYLVTLTTRTAIDHLRSARVARETYVGPWLPEPVPADPAPDAADPAILAESLSMAFLVVLEALSPDERAVLLLHDVFGYSHAEVGAVLGRSEASSRQVLRRARQRIEAGRPRFDVDRRHHDELVRRFRAACEVGDVASFLAVLAPDATFVSDGGSRVRAARRPIVGAVKVARFLAGVLRHGDPDRVHRIVEVNGHLALARLDFGALTWVLTVEPSAAGGADVVRLVRNPDKLTHISTAVARRD